MISQEGKSTTAIICLKAAAAMLGVTVDDGRIAGITVKDTNTLLRVVKSLKLTANVRQVQEAQLTTAVFPAIALKKDGSYALLSSSNETHVLLFDPAASNTEAMTFTNFFSLCTGDIITLKRPLGLSSFLYKYNLSWFKSAIVKYKNIYAEILLAAFFLQLLGIVTPLITQVVLDKVIVNKGQATLDVLAAVLLAAALFQAFMSMLRSYLSAHTANKLDMILGARLFRHLVMLPLRYFEVRRVGDTLTRIAALNTVREFMTGAALTALLDAVFSVIFLAIMFYYSMPLTLIVMTALPLFIGQNVWAAPLYRERLEKVWTTGAENNSFLVEAITGVNTVKSLALEPQFNYKWGQLTKQYISAAFNSSKFNILLSSISTILQKLISMGILFVGGHMVMDGDMTIGQLVAFQMLSGQASAPLYRLTGMWQSFQQTLLSLERLGDILKVPPESPEKDSARLRQIKGEIVFQNVVFRYRPDGHAVLNELTIKIVAGQKVGIVGRSGSGKSTLAKLMGRLYVPDAGEILLDGTDISKLDPLWLRKQIGVVLQENYLFYGSVRQNIAFTNPSASIQEVIAAAKLAGAHEFILELPEGYDTILGERGTGLSGGQQQRLAIARALITRPSILIFDEATSSLDYESERVIMDNFQAITRGHTVLMIAHRLSTVRQCDVILVLDGGKVVEYGTHEELLARRSFYYNLYVQQEV